MRAFVHFLSIGLFLELLVLCPAQERSEPVRLRFVDSVTGYAIKPDLVEATSRTELQQTIRMRRGGVKRDGHTSLNLDPGEFTLRVTAPGYQPVTAEFVVSPQNRFQLVFELDPLTPPAELSPERLQGLLKADETLVVGFVVDDVTGQPLREVLVRATPSGREGRSNARGYFELHVPVPPGESTNASPSGLTLSRPGYRSEQRQHLELWSEGAVTYRIRLQPGSGVNQVDEREFRRRPDSPVAAPAPPPPQPTAPVVESPEAEAARLREALAVAALLKSGMTPQLVPAVPVRIPTNIRVLRKDGITIDYISLQTYTARSLPSEWIPAWANYGPGGSGTNCLLAGAVAVRTYAIGYINNPYHTNYDICGTGACQVYNHDLSYPATTAAVIATRNFVMIQPGTTRIGFKLAEYSAENNQRGRPCGDGFTAPVTGCLADPVCTGETSYGHGRGMCQWGSARWATGRKMANRNTSDGSTNGYPIQDWVWICEHYHPHLRLVQGAPLTINDYVQVQGTPILAVRENADGGISGGVGSPTVATIPAGTNGAIVAGPVQVTSDGVGYTWWRVRWFDSAGSIGWAPENWLERVDVPRPAPPVLADIANHFQSPGRTIRFTNSVNAPLRAETWLTDFENFPTGSAAGPVLFRSPALAETTATSPALQRGSCSVTDRAAAGATGKRVLHASWTSPATSNTWLRLTTADTARLPNPVVDLTRRLAFDIYADRPVRVALGIRETVTAPGTAIGTDGGTTPDVIELVGVTNVIDSQPQPLRLLPASNWVTLTFDLPVEPTRNFIGGDGVLATPSGLGVLEHLALVPADGPGDYTVYLDNFLVSTPSTFTYSLSNAPAGAWVHPESGVFVWTPDESQAPGVFHPTIQVADNNLPPRSDARRFTIVISATDLPPLLAAIPPREVHSGTLVTISNVAVEEFFPPNTLTFTLGPGAPAGATVEANSGVFTWSTRGVQVPSTNSFSLRVTEEGIAARTATQPFLIVVLPRPNILAAEVSGMDFLFAWSAIPGQRYRVEFTENLADPKWNPAGPDLTATVDWASAADLIGTTQRFYRVQVLP